jgi:hypothetical protein
VGHDTSVTRDGPAAQRFKDGAALTFGGRRAILPAFMRRLALMLLALLALAGLSACSNACQDLGDRICSCAGGGTSSQTCKQQIKNLLDDQGISSNWPWEHPKGSDRAFCASRLAACHVPEALVSGQTDDALFCEWVNTACGKASCGLSQSDPCATGTDAVCSTPPTALCP